VIAGCDGLVSKPWGRSAVNRRSRTAFGTGPEKFCLVGVQLESVRRHPVAHDTSMKMVKVHVGCSFIIKVTRESSVTLTIQQQHRRSI